MKKILSCTILISFVLLVTSACSHKVEVNTAGTKIEKSEEVLVGINDSKQIAELFVNQDEAISNDNQPSSTSQKEGEKTVNSENVTDANSLIEAKKVEILLSPGDSGEKVIVLQKKLFNIGNDIAVDGTFGSQTSEALKILQKSNNLEVNGNYDKKTEEILTNTKDIRIYKVVPKNAESKAVPESAKGLEVIPDIKTSPGNSEQVIVVLSQSYGIVSASFAAYEKANNLWQVVGSGNAVVGLKGFSDNRTEGDKTTPTGKYGIPFLFGQAANPGVKLPYRQVKEGDYWVSNKIIDEYNVWMHYDGDNPKERLYDFEELWVNPLYKYAAVIDFNYGPDKVMGKGSGIFLHKIPLNGGGTLGCIGVSETNVLKILKWLDPSKKPIIIMGVKGRI